MGILGDIFGVAFEIVKAPIEIVDDTFSFITEPVKETIKEKVKELVEEEE